jgi:hypothetical protein
MCPGLRAGGRGRRRNWFALTDEVLIRLEGAGEQGQDGRRYSQTIASQISTPARASRATFSPITFTSPRLRCREIPPTWISTSPMAAAMARAGAMPVSGWQDQRERAEHLQHPDGSDEPQRHSVDPAHHRPELIWGPQHLEPTRVQVERRQQRGALLVGERERHIADGLVPAQRLRLGEVDLAARQPASRPGGDLG